MDINTPLDMKKAMKINGMNKKMYYTILVQFLIGLQEKFIKNMTLTYNNNNWKKFKEIAHNLKN